MVDVSSFFVWNYKTATEQKKSFWDEFYEIFCLTNLPHCWMDFERLYLILFGKFVHILMIWRNTKFHLVLSTLSANECLLNSLFYNYDTFNDGHGKQCVCKFLTGTY